MPSNRVGQDQAPKPSQQTGQITPSTHAAVEKVTVDTTPTEIEIGLKIYEIYRKRVEHQDVLIHHRTSFQLVAQAALITAYFAISNMQSVPAEFDRNALRTMVSIGGVLISLAGVAGTAIARRVSENVAENYRRIKTESIVLLDGEETIGIRSLDGSNLGLPLLPPIRSASGWQFFGFLVAYITNSFPLFFWIWVLLGPKNGSSVTNAILLAIGLVAAIAVFSRYAKALFESVSRGVAKAGPNRPPVE